MMAFVCVVNGTVFDDRNEGDGYSVATGAKAVDFSIGASARTAARKMDPKDIKLTELGHSLIQSITESRTAPP